MDKHQVFARLRELGVSRAVVEFSGGNDEGGADAIELFYDDGQRPAEQLAEYAERHVWDEAAKRWVEKPITPQQQQDEELAQTLVKPVYDQYGGFAGDFSVDGTVTWYVADGTVRLRASESVEAYESVEAEW